MLGRACCGRIGRCLVVLHLIPQCLINDRFVKPGTKHIPMTDPLQTKGISEQVVEGSAAEEGPAWGIVTLRDPDLLVMPFVSSYDVSSFTLIEADKRGAEFTTPLTYSTTLQMRLVSPRMFLSWGR